jgi:hypothetical protein
MRCVGLVAILLSIVVLQSSASSVSLSTSDRESVRVAADYIVCCQLPNGLIAQTPDEKVRAVPYFANQASIGLLHAYQVTGEKRYLDAVLRYIDWYGKHINPDGTAFDWAGTRADPVSTGGYDSTDAYPATFISLCYEAFRVVHDRDLLRSIFPTVIRSVSGIVLTMQSDGLTYAKPNFKIKYLMDNLEVRSGLRDAVKIAAALGDREKAGEWKSLERRSERGLLKMWQPKEGVFSMCIYENGSLNAGFADWYPDGMANAMALTYLLDKRDQGAVRLCRLVRDKYPDCNDYWRFSCLWKFGYKAEAAEVRAKMSSSTGTSADRGLYIRALVPEKDDLSEPIRLPDASQ